MILLTLGELFNIKCKIYKIKVTKKIDIYIYRGLVYTSQKVEICPACTRVEMVDKGSVYTIISECW